jgi:molybdenum cofactor cytidylyltransferase
MKVAALVLAAGSSVRFGSSKQLAPWGDDTLLGHVLERVAGWPVDETWLVLGSDADEILDRVDPGEAVVVVNESHEGGLSSSLKVGLDALLLGSRMDAVLIVLGDQPTIPDEVPGELIEGMRDSGLPVAIPKYRYERGNPVLVSRLLWERLMSLEGDEGARGLFAAHPEWVHEVWINALPPRDIDTPEDHAEMRPRT